MLLLSRIPPQIPFIWRSIFSARHLSKNIDSIASDTMWIEEYILFLILACLLVPNISYLWSFQYLLVKEGKRRLAGNNKSQSFVFPRDKWDYLWFLSSRLCLRSKKVHLLPDKWIGQGRIYNALNSLFGLTFGGDGYLLSCPLKAQVLNCPFACNISYLCFCQNFLWPWLRCSFPVLQTTKLFAE